ncbi:MAG: hypothetical protein AAF587_44505 [Bacteroidota bacterium]
MKQLSPLAILLAFTLSACQQDEQPLPEAPKQHSISILYGNNQQGFFNEWLPDSLVIQALDPEGMPAVGWKIQFDIIAGDGSVNNSDLGTDSSGIFYTYWVMGCTEEPQEVAAYLLNALGKPIDTAIFSASVSPPNGWGRACGMPCNYGDSDREFETFDGRVYLVNCKSIYTTDNYGANWEEIEGIPTLSPSSTIFDLQFNSQGRMYILTEKDGIFYSEDHKNWTAINGDLPGFLNPLAFLVEDSSMFVSFYGHGLFRSVDGGNSWQNIPVEGENNWRFEYIRRHPNGDLYLLDTWYTLRKSADNGDTWEEITLDNQLNRLREVEAFEIDDSGILYFGESRAQLSMFSTDTYQSEKQSFYEANHSSQYVSDIRFANGIVYFVIKGNPTPGIYSSENWERQDIGFKKSVYSHYLQSDGTFLINSQDGLYYFNQ